MRAVKPKSNTDGNYDALYEIGQDLDKLKVRIAVLQHKMDRQKSQAACRHDLHLIRKCMTAAVAQMDLTVRAWK